VALVFFQRHRYLKVMASSPMTMKTLLTVTAAVEAGAGLALLGVPSLTASLLLGAALGSAAAVSLARIGGAAILALAIACWLTRDTRGLYSRGLVVSMAFYNVAVAAVLARAGFGHGLHGMLLWPAVAFHVAMGAWCAASLYRNENAVLR
jgi:uncharacterized membrane protein SpoIIM required for sporulation